MSTSTDNARESYRNKVNGQFGVQPRLESEAQLTTAEGWDAVHSIVVEELRRHRIDIHKANEHTRGYADGIDEELTNEVCLAAWHRIQNEGVDVDNAGGYVRGIARNMIVAHKRPKDRDSVDVKATAIWHLERESLEKELGRNLTTEEGDALASEIRENWEIFREGSGKRKRKPKKNFHHYENTGIHTTQLEYNVVGRDGSEQEVNLADLIQPMEEDLTWLESMNEAESITAEVIQSERKAAEIFLQVKEKHERELGRKLSLVDEDNLAEAVRRKWPEKHEFRPRSDFHRQRTSFSNPQVSSWGNLVKDKRISKEKAAWNIYAENRGIPPVEVGVIPTSVQRKTRKTMGQISLGKAIEQWEDGESNANTEALFAPWPGASNKEKAQIADFLYDNLGPVSDGLWSSALFLASSKDRFSDESDDGAMAVPA